MALSNDEVSNWRGPEDFYRSISEDPIRHGNVRVDSDVWGRLQRKEHVPRPGDGIAFYHTSRARFGAGDPFKRRPRISAMGALRQIEYVGQEVFGIVADIPIADLILMAHRPIVREGANVRLFEKCGMVVGAVATFFEVPADVWARFVAHVK